MSASDAPPKPRDVMDFRFNKLRNVRISDGNVDVPPGRSVNLLAVSNKYGLVFAATQNDVRVVRTVDIERLDEDKSPNITDACDYPSACVKLRERPWHLGLSCDDLTLSVCVLRDSCAIAELYDVRCVADRSRDIEPFTCVRLSSKMGVEVIDLKWNPEVANTFAACLSDGSVCTWSVDPGSIKICGCINSAPVAATAICWSPKGKQLVVGRMDGSLVQYLPNLQEAKSVPAPTIFENSVAVVNVTWLSSFQFAVTYLVDGRPNLVLVTSQKGKPCSYVNYDEICYGTSDSRQPQYYVAHLAEWGLLMCSSSNAIEVSVLAKIDSAAQNWEQWILEDSGRAELPLLANDETYPLGMALDFTSQRRLPINDTDFMPAKPIVHILSTGGTLCSFYAISNKANEPHVQRTPMELSIEGARKPNETVSPKPQDISRKLPNLSEGPARILTPTSQQNFGSIVSGKPASIGGTGSIISGTPIAGSNLKTVSTPTAAVAASVHPFGASQVLAQRSAPPSVPSSIPASHQQSVSTLTPKVLANNIGSATPLSVQKSSSPSKKTAASQSVLVTAIKEEIRRFEAEVMAQRKSSTVVLKMEEAELKNIAAGVQRITEFVNEAKKATRGLNVDVHTVRGRALETYGSVEEAISLERRTKDKQFVKLLRTRGLDPLSVKKMRDVRTLAYYVEQQMRDVHAVLDSQWDDHEALRQRRSSADTVPIRRISESGKNDPPKIEMIYRTVSTNLNAMYLQEQQIDAMLTRLSQIEANKRNSTKPFNRPPVQHHPTIWSVGKQSDASRIGALLSQQKSSSSAKRMTLSKCSNLRSVLEKRRVTHIRPPSPFETEFSRLLSPSLQMDNDLDDNDVASDIYSAPVSSSTTSSFVAADHQINKTPPMILAHSPQPSIFSVAAIASNNKGGHPLFEVNIGGLKLGSTPPPPSKIVESASKAVIEETVAVSPKMRPPAASSFSFTAPNHGFNFSKFSAASSFDSCMFRMNSSISGKVFGSKSPLNTAAAVTSNSNSMNQLSLSVVKPIDSIKPPPPSSSSLAHLNGNTSESTIIEGRGDVYVVEEEEEEEEDEEEEEEEEELEPREDEEDDEEDEEEEEEEGNGEEEGDGEEYLVEEAEEEEGDDAELVIGGGGASTPISIPVSLKATESISAVPQMTSSISPTDVAKPAPVLASLIAGKSSSDVVTLPVQQQQQQQSSIFGTPITINHPVAFSQSAGSGFTALFGSSSSNSPASVSTAAVTASTFRFVSPDTSPSTASQTSASSQSKLPTFAFKLPTPTTTSATATAISPNETATTSIFGHVVNQTSSSTTSSTSTIVSPVIAGSSIFGSQQPTTSTTTTESTTSTFGTSPPAGAAAVTQTGTPAIFGGVKPLFGAQQAPNSPTPTSKTTLPFFGQSSPSAFSSNQPSAFGAQPTSAVFGQPQMAPQSPAASSFGSGGTGVSNIFGSQTPTGGTATGFFSGLGGKPNPDNANRNIFGGSSNFGVSTQSTTLFSGAASGSLWSKPAGSTGSFQSGTTVGGVGQTGFGGFQQQSPPRTGGFGGVAAFGATPSFGATPAFGGAPSFGGINPVGGRVFGSSSPVVSQDAAGFGSIAASTVDSPSFGALATSATMGFSQPGSPGAPGEVVAAPPPSIFGVQTPSFGSGGSVFGGTSNPPANQGAFGTAGSSPSFSQWRS